MPVKIDVKVKDQEVKKLFSQLQSREKNLTPAMKIVGEIIRTSVIRNFEAGGRPEKWKPLRSISYFLGYTMGKKQKAYSKKGALTAKYSRYLAGKKVLIGQGMGGGLMGSISYKAGVDSVRVGTNKVYAALHQFGGKAGRNRKVAIPARPYLMVQEEDWTEIKEALRDYLLRPIRG